MYSINNLEDSNRGLSSCCMYTKKGRETAINASFGCHGSSCSRLYFTKIQL